jgi:iron complex outermembrane recepter protein
VTGGLNQTKMLKFIFSAGALLFSLITYGQFVIKGSVSDAKSNALLTGASVRLDGSTQITTSDQTGSFTFENVAPGQHTVSITYVGYSEKQIPVAVSGNTEIKVAITQSSVFTDEVVVSSTRAHEKTPTTFSTIDKESIQNQNFGQDAPFLMNWTPSVVTTSDAGAGVGYTGIRIRGSDGSRINVTINGIPYNDSESLGTFWVDIPDIASSSQSIQIQRGVGSSTNGGGAFGASINLQTNTKNDTPYAEVVNSAGSFKTHRHTVAFGTGLMNNHWIVEGRASKIASDGFIDRASSDLKSYYLSAGYFTDKSVLKAVAFGGHERTYQAWYGVPESRLENNNEEMELTVINEGWNKAQSENLFASGSRTFNPYTYKNQVDDYQQDNFQLHFSHQFAGALTWNTALHYTPGKGYYEEYRMKDDLTNYGLTPVTIGDSVITNTDLIRRRWLDNDFYGFTWSLNYDKNDLNVIWGGGLNRYDGDHFGQIIWSEVAPVITEHQYYFNNGDKRDFNSFVKVNYQVTTAINGYIDLQFRKVTYDASGIENKQNSFDVGGEFNFFNPKFGATYSINDRNHLYGSFAVSHREPVRDDFVEFPGNQPKAEELFNTEIGYRKVGANHSFHANYYLMNYKNQLVLTGQLNDVGGPIRTNAGESYRTGIELEAAVKIRNKLQLQGNLTLSDNRIKSYTEVLADYGENFDEFNMVENVYDNTPISFSPSIIAGTQLTFFPFESAEVTLLSKYVGKQYLDNTGNDDRSLDPYLVNDLRLTYTWKPEFVKSIAFSLLINNMWNEAYESNGYTWGYLYGSNSYRANYYYPQAGRNFLAMIAIKI